MYAPHSYQWVHVVFNFIGENKEEVIRIYNNGAQIKNEIKTRIYGAQTTHNGAIVIGRQKTNSHDNNYASVKVDELYFFNQILSETEIMMFSKISA